MFLYFSDERTLCISYAKVGTSFLGALEFEESRLFTRRGSAIHGFQKENFSDFENLIIVYREPYERFYSGIIHCMITSSFLTPQDIESFSGTKNINFSNIFTSKTFWNHKLSLLKQRIDSNPHNGNLHSFFNSMYEWHRHCNPRLIEYKNKGFLDYIDNFVNIKKLNFTLEKLKYDLKPFQNTTKNNLFVNSKEEVLDVFKSEWNKVGLKKGTDIFLKEEVEIFNFIEEHVSNKR